MTQKSNKEFHNSEYNRRLVKVVQNYHALLRVQMKTKLKELQEGARAIAGDNPELQKVCTKLDQLEIK